MREHVTTVKTTVEMTPQEKRALKMDAARRDEYMKDVGGEAIGLVVNFPEELLDELEADDRGQAVSQAIKEMAERHDVDLSE